MKIDEQIVTRPGGYVIILRLVGKMTLGEGDWQLKEAVDNHLEAGGRRFLLDLEQVSYMDQAGLGEVVRCYINVSRAGGQLKLLKTSKRIWDLLSVTRLLTVFEKYDDEQQAIKSFTGTMPSTALSGQVSFGPD